jgi:RNA polymerase sigma-70 factor, ECF subfamily
MKPNKNINEIFIDYCKSGNSSDLLYFEKEINRWLFNKISFDVKDYDDAKDLTQEAWLKILENKDKFNPEISSFKTWVFRKILFGLLLHYFRDKKLHTGVEIPYKNFVSHNEEGEEVDYIETNYSDDITPIDKYEMKEIASLKRQIFRKLKPNHQDVFILKTIARLPELDIAEIMNTNYNTIRNWYRLSKQAVQTYILKLKKND